MDQVHIRINDYQILDGVKEYSVEVAIPGKYVRTFIGSSQEELLKSITDSFRQIFILVGIPPTTPKVEVLPASPDAFFDEHGKKQPVMPGFHAMAKATFGAQVIRNGKVIEED
jgi:hypothetical protein